MAGADHLPLAGKRVVVTRSSEQSAELRSLLVELGAEVISYPVLGFFPLEDSSELDAAIRNLPQFDWLIFTSQNAVFEVAQRSQILRLAPKSLQNRLQIAAVGEATAAAAREAGYAVHWVGTTDGVGLAEEMAEYLPSKRVLLPRSDRARPELPAALRSAGAEVVEVVAYRTREREETDSATLQRVTRGDVDVVIFASPSAFHALGKLAGPERIRELGERLAYAAIGPVTAEAIRSAGTRVAIQAEKPTSAGLAAAIVKYYAASSQHRVTRP